MEEIVQIPRSEYEAMKEKISLLEDSELMKKLSRLVDILYEERHGLYMGDDTSDLTAATMRTSFQELNSPWDNV